MQQPQVAAQHPGRGGVSTFFPLPKAAQDSERKMEETIGNTLEETAYHQAALWSPVRWVWT